MHKRAPNNQTKTMRVEGMNKQIYLKISNMILSNEYCVLILSHLNIFTKVIKHAKRRWIMVIKGKMSHTTMETFMGISSLRTKIVKLVMVFMSFLKEVVYVISIIAVSGLIYTCVKYILYIY